MPPLTNAAVLVLVYNDSLPDAFLAASAPPTPNLDRIVEDGVTTGLMLSDPELTAACAAQSLQPHLTSLAVSQSPSGVSSLRAEHTAEFLSTRPPSTRLIIIDAGSDLSLADAAVAEAAHAFSSRAEHEPTRSSNPAVPPTASALIGVLVAASAEWNGFLPMPFSDAFAPEFPLPKQSFRITEEHTTLAGFVAWSGEGLVRKDYRSRLGHAGTSPGEGFLTLEQMIAEPLSKTGLLGKYGA